MLYIPVYLSKVFFRLEHECLVRRIKRILLSVISYMFVCLSCLEVECICLKRTLSSKLVWSVKCVYAFPLFLLVPVVWSTRCVHAFPLNHLSTYTPIFFLKRVTSGLIKFNLAWLCINKLAEHMNTLCVGRKIRWFIYCKRIFAHISSWQDFYLD